MYKSICIFLLLVTLTGCGQIPDKFYRAHVANPAYESGRAAFFGEAAMFTAQLSDLKPVGMNAPQAEQNAQFILNLMHWLSRLL